MEETNSSALEEPEPTPNQRLSTILYMSTFPPRECGIATFTEDLVGAIDKQFHSVLKSKIIALNDDETTIYNYGRKVLHDVYDNDIHGYIETAKKINNQEDVKLISIQHEFGIFGGEYGDHLLAFLEALEKPAIVTFHSVLPNPDEKLKQVVQAISRRVESIVVMTPSAIEILRNQYGLQTTIHIIPHGIPTVQYETQKKSKKNIGYDGKFILSSFGMLSRGKGYEYVIEALPEIVKEHPNLIYLIVGATHPVVRRREGEEYRNYLKSLVSKHNLQNNVKFYNRYVDLDEIINYLKASNIYISASQNPDQITSGTLSYALGCGRAVISTPFAHAKDAITPETGALVEFEDSKSFTESIKSLISNQDMLKKMERNAYAQTRQATWPNVAISYGKIFNKYLDLPDIYFRGLPKLNLTHLKDMTDDFGMIQFANYTRPDINSGYTLDDNVRALVVCGLLYKKYRKNSYLKLLRTYLEFIKYVQFKDGKIYNYVDKNKIINKSEWVEDAHSRAIWALGFISSLKEVPPELRRESKKMIEKALDPIVGTKYSRSMAFTLIGLYHYNKFHSSERNLGIIKKFADELVSLYEKNSSDNWRWFEPALTYSNSTLTEALFYAYLTTNNKKYLDIAIITLEFLISKTFENNVFIPIGQKGWYAKDEKRAYFDQQPIDAGTTLQTLVAACKVLDGPRYRRYAKNTFNWFLGKNTLNQFMYSENNGGCYDGLGESSVNLNQGAESTLAYLNSRVIMSQL